MLERVAAQTKFWKQDQVHPLCMGLCHPPKMIFHVPDWITWHIIVTDERYAQGIHVRTIHPFAEDEQSGLLEMKKMSSDC
jgi:hypothetical protein